MRWHAGPWWRQRQAPAPNNQRSDHRNGLPLLPWMEKGAPVDLELVNNLRDELA